ncbi:mercury(II) reductase [Candidatus Saccharibacteria bacterium]|nr:MAG: mercury(II) reductase [Candidatus Saccharibacteria bacterium]
MEKYDLGIVGGGAGAFAAAIRADELGIKTVMINEGLPLGGTCLNVGCVPSKALLHAAEKISQPSRYKVSGVDLSLDRADFATAVRDEIALVEELRREKYEQVLQGLGNVTLVEGLARFTTDRTIEVNGKIIEAEKFIIATGSKATVPQIKGLQEAGYLTHIEALKLRELPEALAVIGAGPIGLELGQIYSRFGSKVTILQRAKSIMPRVETELTDRLEQSLTAEGIAIVKGAKVTKVVVEEGKKVISYNTNDGEQTVVVDEILLAAGKTPNTAALGLSEVGVEVDDKQAVVTSKTLQTSQPNIYAVGDVTNLPLRLETTAGKEGTIAVDNAFKGTSKIVDYKAVPWAVFTDPAIGSVGYTEEEQMAEFNACACRTVEMDKVSKALITGRTEGVIRMAIHPETRVVMGVHILAPNAADLIAQAMVHIRNKNTIDDIIDTLPVFPTMSEAIKIAAISFTKDVSKMSCCT